LSFFAFTYKWDDQADFIDQAFWDSNPTSGEIIEATFGTAGKLTTAYTQHWSGYTSSTCLSA
jgi:hypothetical protein